MEDMPMGWGSCSRRWASPGASPCHGVPWPLVPGRYLTLAHHPGWVSSIAEWPFHAPEERWTAGIDRPTRVEGDIHVSSGLKVAWFKDPDGNILNLISPEDTWGSGGPSGRRT